MPRSRRWLRGDQFLTRHRRRRGLRRGTWRGSFERPAQALDELLQRLLVELPAKTEILPLGFELETIERGEPVLSEGGCEFTAQLAQKALERRDVGGTLTAQEGVERDFVAEVESECSRAQLGEWRAFGVLVFEELGEPTALERQGADRRRLPADGGSQ